MSYQSLVRGSGQTATVTRQADGARTAYGRSSGGWQTVYEGPCYAELLTGEENRSDRETQWRRLNVFLLADASDILDSDRITISGAPGGTDLNIEMVRPFRNPRKGTVDHVEVRTRDEL